MNTQQFYGITIEDRNTCTLYQDTRTKTIYAEGKLMAKYRPSIDEDGVQDLDEIQPTLTSDGHFHVGYFRCSRSSTLHACNGRTLPSNPNLLRIKTVSYDTAMEVLYSKNPIESLSKI